MSGYRSYVPWPKTSAPSYSSKKDSPSTSKYESSYSRTRPEAKKIEDKSSSTLGSKYSAYSAGYQRDSGAHSSSALSTRTDLTTRYKATPEKKDTSHPPITYRPLTRTTTSRSRDPSPVDRDKTESSSSSSYNLNRLYPRSYTRSASRERTESISSSTIPKYSGRTSLTKDDIKYSPLGKTSREVSREDLTATTTSSTSSSSRYKCSPGTLRAPSREDLNKSSQKYINSRFLPKNSVEKSYTAYTRPSASRTSEVSRKNRELLNVLSTQSEDRSRPASRCSSVTQEEFKEKQKIEIPKVEPPKINILTFEDLETVIVVTRSTSPNVPNSHSSVVRTKRLDNARTIEKQITRSKIRPEMIDKEIQSDRLDDSTKSSRFAGASRIATYLDLKYSSPNEEKQNKPSSAETSSSLDNKDVEEHVSKRDSDSPKSLSRNSSTKSLNYPSSRSSTPKDSKSKSSASMQYDKTKSKLTPPRSVSNSDSKNQLPPQVPKSDSPSRSFNPLNTPNKDFRKSVLNMNTDTKLRKKNIKRSNSVSSADSDGAASEATEVSENLSSCVSYPKSSSISKLPQKINQDDIQRSRRSCTRSPTVNSEASSATTSSSEDDAKAKASKGSSESKLKKLNIALTRNTIPISSPEDTEKSPKPPLSPRIKGEGPKNEAEAKSFLMRALAPVTNLFKARQDSSEKLNWLDSTCDNISEIKTDSISSDLKSLSDNSKQEDQRIPTKIEICRLEPNDEPFYFPEAFFTSDTPKSISREQSLSKNKSSESLSKNLKDVSEHSYQTCDSKKSTKSNSSNRYPVKIVRHVDSGEIPWWLQENPDIPEGVIVWPATSIVPDGETEDGRTIYKVRNDDSNTSIWWFEETEESRSLSSNKSRKCQIKLLKHIDSGEKAWWLDENSEVPEGVQVYSEKYPDETNETDEELENNKKSWWIGSSENLNKSDGVDEPEFLKKYKIRHIDSGERAWWLSSVENIAEDSQQWDEKDYNTCDTKATYQTHHIPETEIKHYEESDNEFECQIPLGDRASPEGLETPKEEESRGRISPYDNIPNTINKPKSMDHLKLFISKHTNIDDVLGGSSQLLSPLMSRIFSYEDNKRRGDEICEKIDPGQVRIHDSTPQRGIIQPTRLDIIGRSQRSNSPGKLDDAALQLYKDGDYGSYLDLEASISEQQEEFEEFQSSKKNSIVLRTQLSVRVHTIIEKLLTSEGRELRRALFSLKQIFQEDKDLVHEFVQNDGLACLIKVGSEADQNYQNYILRALGQVMLYVDGMNGVMEHNETIQWLYTLISSKFRLVVKTALKLLLVFVEYIDTNCMLLIKAIHTVDYSQGLPPWHNIMKLLKDFDSADTELLIYATTLINKCLNGVPDQDTYYDQTDALEEQGIEAIIRRYMSKPGTDLDLLQQFQIYEAVLQYEDGEEKGTPIRHLDENIRKTLRSRKSGVESVERRKSRRHSTGNTPIHSALNNNSRNNLNQTNEEDDDESSSSQSSEINNLNLNGSYKDSNKANDAGVTPALRRRRERAERQRSFMKEQQENGSLLRSSILTTDENTANELDNCTNGLQQRLSNGNILNRNSSRKDLTPLLNAVNKIESEENGLTKQPWILSMMYGKPHEENKDNHEDSESANENDRNLLLQLKKENTVKDLTQKLSNQNVIHSPSDESKINRIGDMSGLISKAKEGLAKSKSQANVIKSPTVDNIPKTETKKSENELRWEELATNLNRPLSLCDLDFRDLTTDDENDILAPVNVQNGIPPPPPPLLNDIGVAPPPPPLNNRIPPPVPNPPVFSINLQRPNGKQSTETKIPMKKTKKTVKLFWKEVRDDPISAMKLKSGFIWDELNHVMVDTQKLEHLFESRAKDLISKKQQELNKNKEIIVLDPKRSNAINIGMTKLPQPRSIKTAILKMDATIMNREGIEKLLTMLPTEEERTKIQEAQAANPDLPLGSAEQFLLTLASISELPARLKLWAFKLDFENTEREIAEPLMDLKQGFEVLRVNKTFRAILSTLLSVGNFLNGNEVKGFQIEYLSKVPEVKDTVHKHSLLHHLCHIVMEKFPDASDLYSEIGAITRASKVDFDELALNIQRLEADCKASWDHLKLIAKHDGSNMMKIKMSDFLADCAERIILLSIIHRRVLNRFHKFLLWLGIPLHQIGDTKPNEFCRVISEFSLEYRTTRERVLQQLEKKANHRERNKTRGKMITETGKFRTKEDRADAELRQLLGSDISDVDSMQGTLPWRRTRRESNRSFMGQVNGNLTDGDDEILESLVKTATKAPSRTAPRERKRTRHADRKSLKRSRTRENNPMGSRDSP